MQPDANVFRQSLRFPRSFWRVKFFVQTFIVDLLWPGRYFLSTKTRSVSSSFPDRSHIGLSLNWVGLESITRWPSPNDCWTNFPTGCCSTVEPDWSFPLAQSWSFFKEIFLVVVEETNIVFHTTSLHFSIFQLLQYRLEVPLEEWWCSILFDRTLILLWFQNQYRHRIPRLVVSSMHCARIALDVVQRSYYVLGLCDFHFLDQQARRTLFVFCANLDLQVPIHCW